MNAAGVLTRARTKTAGRTEPFVSMKSCNGGRMRVSEQAGIPAKVGLSARAGIQEKARIGSVGVLASGKFSTGVHLSRGTFQSCVFRSRKSRLVIASLGIPDLAQPQTLAEVAIALVVISELFKASGGFLTKLIGSIAGFFLSLLRFVPGLSEGQKWAKLLLSLAIDFIGTLSYTIPFVGDSSDLAWAPISAGLIQALYGNRWLASANLVEEVLPLTDAIPTATLAWLLEYTPAKNIAGPAGWIASLLGKKGAKKG